MNTSKNTKNIGNLGEDIACRFLGKKGFTVLDRQYRKKWGEIDIVARKDRSLHFFEVKSVILSVIPDFQGHRPEENVDSWKLTHIRRMIETYMSERKYHLDTAISFHVLCVYIDTQAVKAKVKWIKDVIL